MKIIARGRRAGKTMEVIRESARTGNYILVSNQFQAQNVFKLSLEMGLSIPYPLTVSEMEKGSIQSTSIKREGILIDNADFIIQQLLGVKVNTMTISIAKEGKE